jgi:hypothetical protein
MVVSQSFGAASVMTVWRVFHVAWWSIESVFPKQHPVMCPTVWTGKLTSGQSHTYRKHTVFLLRETVVLTGQEASTSDRSRSLFPWSRLSLRTGSNSFKISFFSLTLEITADFGKRDLPDGINFHFF